MNDDDDEMGEDWEGLFRNWIGRASETEDERCKNATAMIKAAITEFEPLAGLEIEVFLRGSYPANTNVRQASDVDVAILLRDAIQWDGPERAAMDDLEIEEPGLIGHFRSFFEDQSKPYWEFRGLVLQAIQTKFSKAGAEDGKKSIKIGENSYRVKADVVPCCEFRHYSGMKLPDGSWDHELGVYLYDRDDPTKRIINFPVQDLDNGVDKNNLTNYRYKRVVRIVKCIRDEMLNAKVDAADVPSFLIESMIWNLPVELFEVADEAGYVDLVGDALSTLLSRLGEAEAAPLFTEANGIKPLFGDEQAWALADALGFLAAVMNFVGIWE